MKVEHIQPFLTSANTVLSMTCQTTFKAGKPYVKSNEFNDDSIVICVGVTGQLSGQVLLTFSINTALSVASKMCMMEMTELNDISMSALSELGNMILGNAATVFSTQGILIDITPPTLVRGFFRIDNAYAKNICIPLHMDDGQIIEIDVAVKEKIDGKA